MNPKRRQILHLLLLFISLVLMVGGIVVEKPGASIIGLIVAAVNIQQWLRSGSDQVEQS
jgi:hypothetical protein